VTLRASRSGFRADYIKEAPGLPVEMIGAPPTHHMLDAAVLALRVLPDGDQVDVCVWRLVALDGYAGSHIGVQIEGLPEQQVHGGVARGDGRL